MARNDVYLNINALSPADAVVTGQQDMTAATVPELVLGDTPTFNFYFTDNTNVWPSWAGNASYSLTWALSDAVAGDFSPAATTGNATPITGGWSVVLPLNSYDLVGLLNTKRVGQPYPVTNLWQQLRVTDPSGNEITRAMFWTPVRYRAISDTQNTESASPTGGRFVTVNNVNTLTTPTAAQFYSANPVPTSALGTAANGELLIGNGTGFTKSTLTAGTGITVTNGSGSITIDASGAQETLTATVKNAESVAITKGQVVYIFGATGGFASVKLAYNTSDATSAKTFGVVSSTSIAANGTGTVTCVGVVDGLNLGAYNDGDTLYLGATPGSVTATKPYAPNHLVYVGIVERANAGNGELYVRVQNGYELDEIHDVQINAPKLAGQTLIYDQTNDLWKNARLTGTANQITVTNADAAVTLSIPTNPTLPGNLTVSGTGTSTFGGNLTVNGTGTSTFAGPIIETHTVSGVSASFGAATSLNANGILEVVGSNGTSRSANQWVVGSNGNSTIYVGSTPGTALTGTAALNLGAAQVSSAIPFNLSATTESSSTSTGALVVAGGVGVAKNVSVGGNLTVSGGTITGGTSGLSLAAAGTNQNVALTPSGSGIVTVGGAARTIAAAAGILTIQAPSSILFNANGANEVGRFTTTGNLLLGTTTDGGQKLQVAGVGIFSSTESAVTLYATASGGIQYQLISGGNLGHALGAFKIVDSSTGYVVLNHDKPTSGGTRLSFDGAGNATFAGTVTSNTANASFTAKGSGGLSGYFVSDGNLQDAWGSTAFHLIIKRGKNTSTQNRWNLATVDAEITPDSGAGCNLSFQYAINNGAWTEALKLDRTSNATFAGNIKTAAPSGGTAATWRLGTVATVSPTSPNRTIEVEIGGTTYYIHAKTTNN